MSTDIPEITTSCYASNIVAGDNIAWQEGRGLARMVRPHNFRRNPVNVSDLYDPFQHEQEETIMPNNSKRVVKVFIADPDPKVSADKSLLHTGAEQVTDLTDQELFFEVDIKPLLAGHNESRVKIVDKEASAKFGKDVYLEPIKIRDLRMTVVIVAAF